MYNWIIETFNLRLCRCVISLCVILNFINDYDSNDLIIL